ncbi:ABC transporter ATP-binding protein [Anaerocolumna sp. AGMB13020]|uniref:ABC transporter ATP-binding protein n=1 Tax=Anaerocolumna sp. AGMB13020 TaxID=3081750 RepID=UPI002952D9E1|nr:ABC transporter ATP-binding protein [Anaerocolumna sp. AGMB13020]WOO37814.1 ABC transporter ATP-binding protein [Anaerocolumna sp. AGMB13020]
MKKIIIGEEIVKAYKEGDEKHTVLKQVSVEIKEKEFAAIMGPSGSGKSTLLFALSGMDSIDSGKVVFEEKELSTLKEKELSEIRRTKMGFIFQQPTMLKNLNLLDNILLPSLREHKKNVKEYTKKARLLMKRVGIAELEKRDIAQVSGGQLQRAGICRALMNDPEIVFGDEPTGALNSKAAQEIMDILAQINADGTAILLVTHDAKIAAQTERVIFMSDGKVISELKLSKYNGKDIEARISRITEKMRELGI